ncbi:MAG: hypothetical protein COT35_06680 [Nitrospirae bacterium CG08_land_8_20_14_0_20_52_24]|nr:MAG: hypothetical protein COT35_06680 [Nitrospirae bacterium CG08_land_8_20_14_0_20_52_24]PIX85896.1 MAG: hypothetical protein COZ32_06115 [Nitrospirae bacterium CG_4_10_14_3_um_filter_53_41]
MICRLVLLILIFLPSLSSAQSKIVVLNGIPLVQCKSSIEGSHNINLTGSEQNEYRVLIIKRGEKYFWSSRENRELIKLESGDITIFMEKGGAGYIGTEKRDSARDRKEGQRPFKRKPGGAWLCYFDI